MPTPILIVGTGALACLFAARLSAHGIPITMLGTWPEGLAALRLHGVMLVQPDGSQQAYPVTVTEDPAQIPKFQSALVLVKSWQTCRAARQLKDCLAQEGVALTLQNGLGNREKLVGELGQERVALGVTTTGATLLSSGRVRPGGEGVISVGEHPRLAPLLDMLTRSGFNLEVLDNVDTLIWGKLVINAAINPMTALLKVPNGQLVARSSARQLSADLAREVATVAAALNIKLAFPDPVAAAEKVAERTSANQSSMLQDILRSAPTEIEAICGQIVRIGKEIGVPTPVNYTVLNLIRAIVEGSEHR
jgi:2-dehydropantoate 2-reductase